MMFNVAVDVVICAVTLAAFAVWPRTVFCFLGVLLLALLCIVQPWIVLGLIAMGLVPLGVTAIFILRELRRWSCAPGHTAACSGMSLIAACDQNGRPSAARGAHVSGAWLASLGAATSRNDR